MLVPLTLCGNFPPTINNKEGNGSLCRWRFHASDGDGKAEKEV